MSAHSARTWAAFAFSCALAPVLLRLASRSRRDRIRSIAASIHVAAV
ncbi:hypothetical protein ABT150_39275 [Streptomyces mirabilis]